MRMNWMNEWRISFMCRSMYLADAYSDTLIYLNVFCFCLFVFWQFKERSDESCPNKFIMLIWPRNLDHKIKETLSFSDIYSSTYGCPYFELNISLSFANALARGYPRLIQSRNASQQKILYYFCVLETVLFLCLLLAGIVGSDTLKRTQFCIKAPLCVFRPWEVDLRSSFPACFVW